MNPKVKQWWLKDLRSGKINQDVGVLKSDNGMCCLGVLEDIYRRKVCKVSVSKYWTKEDPHSYGYCSRNNASHILTKEVMDWAQLKSCTGACLGKNYFLSELNDNGYTFSQIADLIEKDF